MLSDIAAWFITLFVVDPLQAEMREQLERANASTEIIQQSQQCVASQGPKLLNRAGEDPAGRSPPWSALPLAGHRRCSCWTQATRTARPLSVFCRVAMASRRRLKPLQRGNCDTNRRNAGRPFQRAFPRNSPSARAGGRATHSGARYITCCIGSMLRMAFLPRTVSTVSTKRISSTGCPPPMLTTRKVRVSTRYRSRPRRKRGYLPQAQMWLRRMIPSTRSSI